MYNGNGDRNYTGSNVNIGGFRIRPLYVYIGIAAILLIALALLIRMLDTSLVMHFGLVAGGLLLLANVRELLGHAYAQHNSTALLNSLIGGALICAWLSQILSGLLWIPALLLIGVAIPLVLGRSSVYLTYMQMARNAVNGVRRAVGR